VVSSRTVPARAERTRPCRLVTTAAYGGENALRRADRPGSIGAPSLVQPGGAAVTAQRPRDRPSEAFGPDLGVRRWTPLRLLGLAGAVALLGAVAVTALLGWRADHGAATRVTGVAVSDVASRQVAGGSDTVCTATVQVRRPRFAEQRVAVPCGVTKGVPTPAWLYADGTISVDQPPPRYQLWGVAALVGLLAGLLGFAALAAAALVGLRIVRWRTER